ncbi:MAG TPA: ABC transporter permease, partial [Spirochaetia bacterium]|nr:ABC transporter permease [Spirochaetia bacterium]
MGIILKYIITSIRERKFRTFLILFAITLSTALFFASSALSLNLQDMYMEVMKKYYGSSNLMVAQGRGAAWNLSMARAEKYGDRLSYLIGTIDGSATYRPNRTESVSFYLRGFRIEDLPVFASFTLAEEAELDPFTGAKVIVSQIAAKRYGWAVGDTITLDMNDVKRHFVLVGIALPTGVFQEGFDRNVTGVVPRDYLAGLYDIRGRVTTAYLQTKSPGEVAPLLIELAADYPRYSVREPVDKAQRESFASDIKTPLMLMTIMVLIMSVFIIYSSFKVITVERMPILGTFRSIGATRRTTDGVLMLETFLYGAVGGICGCLLGIGILSLMTNLLAYNAWAGIRMKTELHFETIHLVLAFALAVGLSFVSCLIPIVRVSRIPVKDIVLNTMDHGVKARPVRFIAACVVLAVAIVVPRVVPRSLAFVADAGCLFLVIAALIALVPFLTTALVAVLQRVQQLAFGNEGALAAKNLRENRNVLNNISLLGISICSLILIFSISFSAIQQTIGFYTDARFELWA